MTTTSGNTLGRGKIVNSHGKIWTLAARSGEARIAIANYLRTVQVARVRVPLDIAGES